jgi:hypothetical protein
MKKLAWGRRQGGELAGDALGAREELVGLEEECGGDGRLIERAGVETAGVDRLGEAGGLGRKQKKKEGRCYTGASRRHHQR